MLSHYKERGKNFLAFSGIFGNINFITPNLLFILHEGGFKILLFEKLMA